MLFIWVQYGLGFVWTAGQLVFAFGFWKLIKSLMVENVENEV